MHPRPFLPLAAALGLTLVGCGNEPRRPPLLEIARFDFEEEGWTPLAERRESAAFEGEWGGYLEGGHRGSSAFSPLIEVGDWELLEVTWHLRIDDVGQRGFRLFLHGYEDVPVPHPAVPDLPVNHRSFVLGDYEEPQEGWQRHRSVARIRKFDGRARWVRLEWRIYSPLGDNERKAGAFAFDEIVIRRSGA